MRLLLDTSTWLWAAESADNLSTVERLTITDTTSELFVSPVSVWEISAKLRGKLNLALPIEDFVQLSRKKLDVPLAEFRMDDALLEHTLPSIHRDPFDRMLICQTITLQAILVTSDELVRRCPIPTIW